MKKVILYSAPSCAYCGIAKDFFEDNGVEFVVYDVSKDEAKRDEMIAKSAQLSLPVIVIGDEVLAGFDLVRIKELLGIK